ncbi:FAD-dependent oxidoreductase [uncultured Tenacibaculum sp.]|uniref:FAD-dependent oxidoreductase n=1 Tax=uncultured Tenacibaculum sp. TaxID=174713 RepID=UPI00260628D9|nr:FAD-dependent oxidoreductase [uncultured Tenacibaculum sp.]
MSKENPTIHIIGAGVSGLVAASVLEQHGYSPTIIEATGEKGGRVKTDYVDHYQLDHGFQVLLTSYPLAQKYLDYTKLDLQQILPGAVIYKNKKTQYIGDPLRDSSFLFSTIFSSALTLRDKLKVFKLNNALKRKTIAEIFSAKETTTIDYLSSFGFSDQAILNFFLPFFSGIFLEDQLETSSRMFEFVYKMFGTGYAAIPKAGMKAIPNQLKDNLKSTTFIYNTKVKSITDRKIALSKNETIESDYTIIATNPTSMVNLPQQINWKSCTTLYFETPVRTIKKPLIGLVADRSSLINNIFFHTSLATIHNPEKELLSITVVKEHQLDEQQLVDSVVQELENLCGIKNLKLIKAYKIPAALPENRSITNEVSKEKIKINDHVFIAGDYLMNGSLNAAMYSGEFAAKTILEEIK